MTTSKGHVTKLIDAHFALRTSPSDEHTMRTHMNDCLACSAYYERALVVSKLYPQAPTAKDRLRAAVGLQRPHTKWRWAGAGSAAAVCAAAWLLWLAPMGRTQDPASGFAERGGSQTGALAVYEVMHNDQRQPLAPGARVSPSSELTASFEAPGGYAFVLLFAVDAQQQLHWYEPAWTDARHTPSAKRIRPQRPYAMDDAVAHAFAPGPAKVMAVFLKKPTDVQAAEAAWRRGDHRFTTIDPEARTLSHNLTVEAKSATP